MRRRGRLIGTVSAVLAAAMAAVAPAPASAQPPGEAGCSPVVVPVGAERMAGTLCLPDPAADTVVVLVPGATYNHAYWDVPVEPRTYNVRAAVNRAGYATFVLDRLGTGASSVPPAATVTASAQADAIHSVIGALRDGGPGRPAFSRVVLGGHSLGSTFVVLEAAQRQDVDAVLLTGFGHSPQVPGFARLLASLVPAAVPGYLTTRPGSREAFYGDGDVAPEVAAHDERTKDVVSVAEVPEAAAVLVPVPPVPVRLSVPLPQTAGIRVPVLLVNGSDDKQFCGPPPNACADDATLHAAEQSFFAGAPDFTARVVRGAGHDLALSRTSSTFQQIVLDWLRETVPPRR